MHDLLSQAGPFMEDCWALDTVCMEFVKSCGIVVVQQCCHCLCGVAVVVVVVVVVRHRLTLAARTHTTRQSCVDPGGLPLSPPGPSH